MRRQERQEGLGCPIAAPLSRRLFCLSVFNFADEENQQAPPKELWEGGNA